ncbi:hypothetical protein [Streptomyces malaysiensis]|uniref:hypothetical protein n=1 Tax=Streptomyces malaysiensis TaxID=92644 RepID=UPI0036CFBE7F
MELGGASATCFGAPLDGPRSSSRRTVAWALCAVIPARQPNSLAGQAGFAAQMPESREVPQGVAGRFQPVFDVAAHVPAEGCEQEGGAGGLRRDGHGTSLGREFQFD